MGPVDAVRSALRQYATFGGRARRSEYWWFALFSGVVGLVAGAFDSAVFDTAVGENGPLSVIVTLALFLPGLAVSWRRMHDSDHHGAWTLIGLVPVVGTIIFIVLAARDSTPGPNRFGPSPKSFGAVTSSVPAHGTGHGQL